ncbi:hypothetical protein NN561_007570 [Cricetulus griseus]
MPTDRPDPHATLLCEYPCLSPRVPELDEAPGRAGAREPRQSWAGARSHRHWDPGRGCARGCTAAHVRPRGYLWALAGVLSSPCSSTTPWHHRFHAARLRSPPRPAPLKLSALAGWARGAHGTSAPSLVLTNAQITPRASFMRCPGGALPTARYSSLGTAQRATSGRQGRCANHRTLPRWPQAHRGRRDLRS